MTNKKQIFIIHGGETYASYNDYINYLESIKVSFSKYVNWKNEYFDKKLGKNFEIIRPRFPNAENAKYLEWKIIFEKYLKIINQGAILIGNSLGGVFLTKYLSENKISKKIAAVILVAAPYNNTCGGEYLGGGFNLGKDLSLIEKNCQNVYLLFSRDDDSVPLEHAAAYSRKLKNSRIILLDDKNGHFKVSEFPEIVNIIKNIK